MMKYWYVLCVRTGFEELVVNILNKRLSNDYYLAFVPTKFVAYRRSGIVMKKRKVCFPGYVFIQSEYDVISFSATVFPVVRTIKDAYYFLDYGEKNCIVMKEEERRNLCCLLDENFCIDCSVGVIKGDEIQIMSGMLKGKEHKIIKINRHNREAIVEINLYNEKKMIKVMLEIESKI